MVEENIGINQGFFYKTDGHLLNNYFFMKWSRKYIKYFKQRHAKRNNQVMNKINSNKTFLKIQNIGVKKLNPRKRIINPKTYKKI